jgi:hypothetical protein
MSHFSISHSPANLVRLVCRDVLLPSDKRDSNEDIGWDAAITNLKHVPGPTILAPY